MKLRIALCCAIVAAAASGCASRPGGDGWVTLIDGANGLENWARAGDANWRAENGAIVADGKTGKANGFLMTRIPFRDFQVHVEFWVSDDANSGIYLRCEDLSKIVDTTCYEANIFDQRPDPKYGTGAIVHVSPVSPMPKAGGKWNTYDITVQGDRLTVKLNGAVTADVRDTRHANGPLGLQYAAGTVKFRKVQVKPL